MKKVKWRSLEEKVSLIDTNHAEEKKKNDKRQLRNWIFLIVYITGGAIN